MESNDTEKLKPSITRHLVTYLMVSNKFAEPERYTLEVKGDLGEWHEKMSGDPSWRCIIEFAILLWD